jgi:uncharacterized membrane protein SirB2
MEAYYFEIRTVHIAAALASGGFHLLRALALNLLEASWPVSILARLASYSIDTVLFTAALTLVVITHQYPFVDSWLTMKVAVVLPTYILLGYWALRAKTFELRLASMAGAIAAFLFIYSIARTHSPLGLFTLG